MTERLPILATLFDVLPVYADDLEDDAVVVAFAACTTRRGGAGHALTACAALFQRFLLEEVDARLETDEVELLRDHCNALADAISDGNGDRTCIASGDLATAFRMRKYFTHEVAMVAHVVHTEANGGDPSRICGIGIATLNDLADRARRGIAELDAALFTTLTGISVHVIAGTIAEPFTPEELYAAGFPEPLPIPPDVGTEDADAFLDAPLE